MRFPLLPVSWRRAHLPGALVGWMRWAIGLILLSLYWVLVVRFPGGAAPPSPLPRSAAVALSFASGTHPLMVLLLGWWSITISQRTLQPGMDREERARGHLFLQWLGRHLLLAIFGIFLGIVMAAFVAMLAGGYSATNGQGIVLLLWASLASTGFSLWIWTLGTLAFWATRSALGSLGVVGIWEGAFFVIHSGSIWLPGDIWLIWQASSLNQLHVPLQIITPEIFPTGSIPGGLHLVFGVVDTLVALLLWFWLAARRFGRT